MKYSPLQLLFPGLVVVATIISYSVFLDQDAPVVGDANAALGVNRAGATTADLPSSLGYQADYVPAQSNGTEKASTQTNDPAQATESTNTPNLDFDGQQVAGGQPESPVRSEDLAPLLQSSARPKGLEIISEVKADPEDPRYADFLENGLTEVMDYLDGVYSERDNIDEKTENLALDELLLTEDSDVRVYFLKEGTIFQNTLGIENNGDQSLIFPNASSAYSYFTDAETRSTETNENIPLIPGDYVDLGQLKKGSLVDLFLIRDGAQNEDGLVFWVDPESNPDQINHAKLLAVYDNNTLIIGFEDQPGGGDKDYNDLVIAVEINPATGR
jgi:hypothetical protein